MSKKYFVCSDIHSFYEEWMEGLQEAGFDLNNRNHHIILCGDLLDRGPEPLECLKFVNTLLDQNRIVCILGNHECLLYDCGRFSHGIFCQADIHNGTDKTVYALAGIDPSDFYSSSELMEKAKANPLGVRYFDECCKHPYYETEHYIFVHSCIPSEEDGRHSTLAEGGHFATGDNPFKSGEARGKVGIEGKTVVFGHGNTSGAYVEFRGYDKQYLNYLETMGRDENGVTHPTVCYDIFQDEGIIGLDAMTVKSHKVNVLVLEEL